MTDEPGSTWSKKRSAWYRDAARSHIFEVSVWVMGLLAFGAAGLAVLSFGHLDTPAGWAGLAGAAVLLAAARGLYTGRAWARWVGGGVALVMAVGQAVNIASGPHTSAVGWVLDLVFPALWGLIAFELLRLSTRATFEQARGE